MSKIAIIALSGFAVSAMLLGGAFALSRSVANWGEAGLPRCDLEPSGQSATRSLAWDKSDSAGVAIPATVHYRRGEGDQLVVKGDSALVPHVRIVDGSVEFDCRVRGMRNVKLDVTLPGREFRSFSLAGMGDMDLEGIDQRDLSLRMAGAGNLTASGKAGALDLNLAGAGDADLGALSADRVALRVAGASNVDVAPKDDLKVLIAGTGTVTLHSEPRNIETHIFGAGRIIHPADLANRHAMAGQGTAAG